MRRRFASSWFAKLCVAALGCSNEADTPSLPDPADGCGINSECSQLLACAFRRCHTACKTTRDCPAG
jgi:hypothetical protein